MTDHRRLPTVLFVCAHNAGRSQLAAGLAGSLAGGDLRVLSAGTDPDEKVSQPVLESLAELSIDRSDQVPQRITEDLVRSADVVVALKPGLDLPQVPGVRYETWTLPDPHEWDVVGIRPLRDHLGERIAGLIAEVEDGPQRVPSGPVQ